MSAQGALALAILIVFGAYLLTINFALVPKQKRPGLIWLGVLAALSLIAVAIIPGEKLGQAIGYILAQTMVFFVFRGIRGLFISVRGKRRSGKSMSAIGLDLTASIFGTLLVLAFFLFSLFQLAAGWEGLHHSFGAGWATAAFVAALIGFTLPIVVGCYLCAHNIWGWSIPFAILYSLPGLAFMIPNLAIGLLSALRSRIRGNVRA